MNKNIKIFQHPVQFYMFRNVRNDEGILTLKFAKKKTFTFLMFCYLFMWIEDDIK